MHHAHEPTIETIIRNTIESTIEAHYTF
jgi:hypothetical protein